MSKTYRALAIVAVVALAVVALVLASARYVTGGWFSYAPLMRPQENYWLVGYLPLLLAAISGVCAPIVSTFSVVVAAQSRRWVWLIILVVIGLIGVYGETVGLILIPRYLPIAVFRPLSLDQLIPQGLPAIAALIFVATARR